MGFKERSQWVGCWAWERQSLLSGILWVGSISKLIVLSRDLDYERSSCFSSKLCNLSESPCKSQRRTRIQINSWLGWNLKQKVHLAAPKRSRRPLVIILFRNATSTYKYNCWEREAERWNNLYQVAVDAPFCGHKHSHSPSNSRQQPFVSTSSAEREELPEITSSQGSSTAWCTTYKPSISLPENYTSQSKEIYKPEVAS